MSEDQNQDNNICDVDDADEKYPFIDRMVDLNDRITDFKSDFQLLCRELASDKRLSINQLKFAQQELQEAREVWERSMIDIQSKQEAAEREYERRAKAMDVLLKDYELKNAELTKQKEDVERAVVDMLLEQELLEQKKPTLRQRIRNVFFP